MSSEIDGVGGVSSVSQQFNVDQITNPESLYRDKTEAINKSLNSAIERAMTVVNKANEVEIEQKKISGLSNGPVYDEKSSLVSEIATAGNEQNSPENSAQDEQMDALVQRTKELYLDLTNWQVAWSIAQRVQTETSAILKSQ